ncbi:unnamed protein product [Acanthosepion pharaonis]|uniref:Uncharacterized protein n=1 Tax=Acanthosepion pharaonis TaxID=158019 RepID=A0A812EXR7_ACAPH|nr:unnamed protein product [Sepia pharaonis]
MGWWRLAASFSLFFLFVFLFFFTKREKAYSFTDHIKCEKKCNSTFVFSFSLSFNLSFFSSSDPLLLQSVLHSFPRLPISLFSDPSSLDLPFFSYSDPHSPSMCPFSLPILLIPRSPSLFPSIPHSPRSVILFASSELFPQSVLLFRFRSPFPFPFFRSLPLANLSFFCVRSSFSFSFFFFLILLIPLLIFPFFSSSDPHSPSICHSLFLY